MQERARQLLTASWPLLAPLLLVALVALIGSQGSAVRERQTIEILTNVVLVIGLYIFVGNTGILSFGHMCFMAIGAYVAALVTIPEVQKGTLLPDLPSFILGIELGPVPGAIVAGLAALLFAALIAAPISRLSGIGAALAMFAVLVIVYQVANNWEAVTRGSKTMLGVPTETTIGSALAWVMVVAAIAYLYQRSAAGLRVRATRDDEFAARAAGISIPRERAVALLISGFVVGIGGFLYAQHQGAFTPASFFLHVTFITIAMLIVGGPRSLAGAVIGALLISIAGFFFDSVEDGFELGSITFGGRDGLSDTALAAVILLVLLYRREGLTNGREITWPFKPKGVD